MENFCDIFASAYVCAAHQSLQTKIGREKTFAFLGKTQEHNRARRGANYCRGTVCVRAVCSGFIFAKKCRKKSLSYVTLGKTRLTQAKSISNKNAAANVFFLLLLWLMSLDGGVFRR
jgi:hypothetical protein